MEDDVYVDPLFVGLTRPATVLGIHFYAFVAEVLAVAIVFLAVGNPFYIAIIIPMHAILYLISAKDPNVFVAIWVWMQTAGKCMNTRFWGGASFSPLSYKKWKE